MSTVYVEDVSKFYGKTCILKPMSFTLETGCIFGIIGHNGSGKTTLIKMIATLLRPSEGAIRVQGFDTIRDSKKVRGSVGLFIEPERAFYFRLTGRENLMRIALLRGIPKTQAYKEVDALMTRFDMSDHCNKFVSQYSKGMKVKLNLIAALLGNPKVLLLDEPISGLDYQSKATILKIIHEYASSGTTIIICSHDIPEVQQICQKVMLLKKGEVVAIGSPKDLLEELNVDGRIEIQTLNISDMQDAVVNLIGSDIIHMRKQEECLVMLVCNMLESMRTLQRNLHIPYHSISCSERSLSDYFIAYEHEED